MPYALSLDIGGSHITAALINTQTRALLESSISRKAVNANASATDLIKTWASAARESLKDDTALSHIGIAMPGPFDYATGISKLEHKFAALFELNVKELLANELALTTPIYFENDASLFALGEYWAGAAKNAERMIGITLGTGLGAGFIEKGNILTQDPRIPPKGELWDVPYLDSIAEAYASGTALQNSYQQATNKILTGKAIAELAYQGDTAAQQCFNDLSKHLTSILEPYLASFQPDFVVIGGNIAKAFDLLSASLEENTTTQYLQSKHFEQAGLLGAAALEPR